MLSSQNFFEIANYMDIFLRKSLVLFAENHYITYINKQPYEKEKKRRYQAGSI